MSDIELLTLSDVALNVARVDDRLQTVGFSQGEIDRFLALWSRVVSALPREQLLHGALLIVQHTDAPALDEASAQRLPSTVFEAQTNKEVLVVESTGKMIKRASIPQAIANQLQGGQWTASLASQASANCCVVLINERSISVYAGGMEVIAYLDIVTRTAESAYDVRRRQSWGDGELLVSCARDRLQERGRRGIWENPELHLLRSKPEELMEEILSDYLETFLLGYSLVERQAIVPAEGRVDLLITLADGMKYIVEIKWIGRAIKSGVNTSNNKVLEAIAKKWNCSHVFVLGDDAAKAGSLQMGFYYQKHKPRKVHLVAYDCRKAREQNVESCIVNYPAPRDLTPAQFKIHHAAVNPSPASKKGKELQAAIKRTNRIFAKTAAAKKPTAKHGRGSPRKSPAKGARS